MGIPALEDGLFANLLIFDYLYYIFVIGNGRKKRKGRERNREGKSELGRVSTGLDEFRRDLTSLEEFGRVSTSLDEFRRVSTSFDEFGTTPNEIRRVSTRLTIKAKSFFSKFP